jgi:hypothetical protein
LKGQHIVQINFDFSKETREHVERAAENHIKRLQEISFACLEHEAMYCQISIASLTLAALKMSAHLETLERKLEQQAERERD